MEAQNTTEPPTQPQEEVKAEAAPADAVVVNKPENNLFVSSKIDQPAAIKSFLEK